MRILIVKDAATRIPREVADRAEALSIQEQGFTVLEIGDDGVARPLAAEPDEPQQAQEVNEATEATVDAGDAEAPAQPPAKRAPKPPAKKSAKR